MPNHCYNILHVDGDTEQLGEFIRRITLEDGGYRIAQLIPMPKVLEGTHSPSVDSPEPNPKWAEWLADGTVTQERYDEMVTDRREAYEKGEKAFAETGYREWYTWAVNNYGTKWGDYNHDLYNHDGDRLELRYDTAWGPFDESFWERISSMFPALEFIIVYHEDGMDFAGVQKYFAGRLVYEDHDGALSDSLPELDWDDEDSIDRYDQAKCNYLDRLYEEAESASTV